MKVRVIQTKINDEQRKALGMDQNYDPQWQITIGKEYLVYSLCCMSDSETYGKAILYDIVDDPGRLLPAPACLFEISDPRPSRYWLANYNGHHFSLNPREFIENQYLTEDILDREPEALKIFKEIESRFKNEFCEKWLD